MRNDKWDLTLCPFCKRKDWVEFEMPHGDPWYRCRNCGKKLRALEIEFQER